MFGFLKKKDINTQTLSDVARGMQHSVNTAERIVEQHYINMVNRYFDQTKKPIMVTYQVSPTHSIEVPLITLINPRALSLEEMSIEMSVRIDDASPVKYATHKEGEDLVRTSFNISFATTGRDKDNRKDNMIDIAMKFKAGDPPEGVARIIDEFTSQLLPHKVEPVQTQTTQQVNPVNQQIIPPAAPDGMDPAKK